MEAEEEGSEASSGSAEMEQKLNQQYYKSLDGFLIVIAKSGDIVYISENAEKYLGLSQVISWYEYWKFTRTGNVIL